jgi:hypothetical protein
MNINEFLSSRGFLDIETVPMFRQLFFSTDLVDFRRDREWLLRIIAHGLLQQQDLEQLQRRRALALLELHVGSQAVSSDREQSYIWIILQNALLVDPQHEYTLNEGIVPWATQLVTASCSSMTPTAILKTISNVSSLLHTICLLPDIEELAKSSLILIQMQGLASAMISALQAAPLVILDSTTEEEQKELIQSRLNTLRWLIEVLVLFAQGSQHQSMLDAQPVSHLVEEITNIEKSGSVHVDSLLPQVKSRLCGSFYAIPVSVPHLTFSLQN